MLGWPLTEIENHKVSSVAMAMLSEEDTYRIYRVTMEVLDGLKMTGLFFQKKAGVKPMVIVQHGGYGTPELISNFYGDTSNYNDMLERVLKQDVHVFAPQLLLWQGESY